MSTECSPLVQALAVTDNAAFQNILVAMRPKTKSSEIPSAHNVGVHLQNKTSKWLRQLKSDIMVSNSISRKRTYSNSQCISQGGSREGVNHIRWLDGGYDEGGLPGGHSTLDGGEGEEMGAALRSCGISGAIREPWRRELGQVSHGAV